MFKCIQVFPLAGHLGSTLFCSNGTSINMLISRYVHPYFLKTDLKEKLPKLMYFKSSHIYYQNTLKILDQFTRPSALQRHFLLCP